MLARELLGACSMRWSVLLVLLLGCVGDAAPTVELESASADDLKADTISSLTVAQARTVLRLIDNTCGDTWCDGDFDFAFKKIVCQPTRNSCTLTTLVTYPAFSDQTPSYYWRSCRMIGVSHFGDLVATCASGYQTLTAGFYDDLSACIQKIEGSIPR